MSGANSSSSVAGRSELDAGYCQVNIHMLLLLLFVFICVSASVCTTAHWRYAPSANVSSFISLVIEQQSLSQQSHRNTIASGKALDKRRWPDKTQAERTIEMSWVRLGLVVFPRSSREVEAEFLCGSAPAMPTAVSVARRSFVNSSE